MVNGYAVTKEADNLNSPIMSGTTGPIEVDRKFWCKVSGFLPGIGLKVQVSARDWGIVPMTEINGTYYCVWL